MDVALTNAPKCYSSQNWPPLDSGSNSGGKKSDHEVVICHPPVANYKESIPPAVKRLVRSGKIKDTVAAIRQYNWDQLIPDPKSDPQKSNRHLLRRNQGG